MSKMPAAAADPEPVTVTAAEGAAGNELDEDELLIEDDVLVEEVSIDGMCGVY
jgi:mycofactocin precursor